MKQFTNQQAWNITCCCLYATDHSIAASCALCVCLIYAFGALKE